MSQLKPKTGGSNIQLFKKGEIKGRVILYIKELVTLNK